MVKKCIASLLLAALSAAAVPAAERCVNMDFSIAPEKINIKRTVTNAKKKTELAEYCIAIPATSGKNFTFQCRLIPQRLKAYAGLAVGIGNDQLAAHQLKVQLRLGDKNRSSLTFGSGNRCTALFKPVQGIKIEPLLITIKYHADSNSAGVLVTSVQGKVVMQKDNVPLKFNNFSANNIIVTVNDQAGVGESYLNYESTKQYLSGKSFFNSKYWSNFAIDDVKITYAE